MTISQAQDSAPRYQQATKPQGSTHSAYRQAPGKDGDRQNWGSSHLKKKTKQKEIVGLGHARILPHSGVNVAAGREDIREPSKVKL